MRRGFEAKLLGPYRLLLLIANYQNLNYLVKGENQMGDNRIFLNNVDPSYERELAARKHGVYKFFSRFAFTLAILSVIGVFIAEQPAIFAATGVLAVIWLIFRYMAKFLESKWRL
jgi:hypothetical protein